jgi:hypothetical protein
VMAADRPAKEWTDLRAVGVTSQKTASFSHTDGA